MLLPFLLLIIILAKFVCFYFILKPQYPKEQFRAAVYAALAVPISFCAYSICSFIFTFGIQLFLPSSFLTVFVSVALITLFEYLFFACIWRESLINRRFFLNVLLNFAIVGYFANLGEGGLLGFLMVGALYPIQLISHLF